MNTPFIVEFILWGILIGMMLYAGPFKILQGIEKIEKTSFREGRVSLIFGIVVANLIFLAIKVFFLASSLEILSLILSSILSISMLSLAIHLLNTKFKEV